MANQLPTDPIEILKSARDTARKMQELATKLTLPSDQRQALAESVAKLVMPGEQLNAMIELAETFGPPQAQIEEIRAVLADQRTQVETMLTDLERVEAMVERLAIATESIAASQEPFRNLLARFDKRTAADDTED